MGSKLYWLIKSEPDVYGLEQLKNDGRTGWSGVRNYQARNFMRDSMKMGDGVLYYHSNAKPTAIMGIAEVCREGYPDPTQFDSKSEYFDPKSKPGSPTWIMIDVKFVEEFKRPVTLFELKTKKGLEKMMLTQKGSRLSVQPVAPAEWEIICSMPRHP